MLKSLHIKNFRGIKDAKIEDLGRINIITGSNLSRKTTLLEAIIASCSQEFSGINYFLHHKDHHLNLGPGYWEELFYKRDIEDPISLKRVDVEKKEITFTISSRLTERLPYIIVNTITGQVTHIGDRDGPTGIKVTLSVKGELMHDDSIFLEAVQDNKGDFSELHHSGNFSQKYRSYTCRYIPCWERSNRKFVELDFSSLVAGSKVAKIIDALNIIDPSIKDLHLFNTDCARGFFTLEQGNSGRYRYRPIHAMGSAINKIMEIFVAIYANTGSIICIDGFHEMVEHGRFDTLFDLLIKAILENDNQLFIALPSNSTSKELVPIMANTYFKNVDEKTDEIRKYELIYREEKTYIETHTREFLEDVVRVHFYYD